MIKFRRTIAIIMLLLFACQSVIAGLGEHTTLSSGDEAVGGFHLDQEDHFADSNFDPHQSDGSDLLDTDCCHAHGHCHVLSVASQVTKISIPSGLNLVSSHTCLYKFLHLNTLLRPPSIV